MDGQITEAVKSVRSEKMISMHEKHAQEYETSMLGKTLEVLLEEEVEIQEKTYYVGHSREYVKVAVEKNRDYGVNDIVNVKVTDFLDSHVLTGTV